MKIHVESPDFKGTVDFKGKNIGDLLEYLGLSCENFVVLTNGEMVLEDEKLKSEDKIKLYPVVSRG